MTQQINALTKHNHAFPKIILLRYKKFVDELINSGFNSTDAYLKVYKPKNRDVAGSAGSRLLANVRVQEILEQALSKLDVEVLTRKPSVIVNAQKLLSDSKNDQVKARMIELLAKIGKITDDSPIVNVIQTNISSELEKIIAKRYNKANKPIIDIVNTSIENTDSANNGPK